jgi:hypothetical protein
MIIFAPAHAAPMTVESPTPPAPMTHTLEPFSTFAVLSTLPTPVVTAQPITAAISAGTCGIFTQHTLGTTTYSAKHASAE